MATEKGPQRPTMARFRREALERAYDLIAATPLEPVARRLWGQLAGLRKPSKRRSLNYDRDGVRIMDRVLAPDSNCVDVGAHRGSVLRDILQRAPAGRHHAIEPIPRLAAELRRRFAGVTVHQGALSDERGTARFCHVMDSPGLSGLRRMNGVQADAELDWIEVPTERLDDLLPPDLPIRFIKIDVEGAQFLVLRGAARTLRRWRPYVVFEHGSSAAEIYGFATGDLWDLLVRQCGMEISLMGDWLADQPSLSRDGFVHAVHEKVPSEFYFVGHPPRADELQRPLAA